MDYSITAIEDEYMSKPKVLIITGYGVNCEAESEHAWKLAGAEPKLVHLNDLLDHPDQLADFQAMMFIGGFSYDYLCMQSESSMRHQIAAHSNHRHSPDQGR